MQEPHVFPAMFLYIPVPTPLQKRQLTALGIKVQESVDKGIKYILPERWKGVTDEDLGKVFSGRQYWFINADGEKRVYFRGDIFRDLERDDIVTVFRMSVYEWPSIPKIPVCLDVKKNQ